VAFDEIRHDLRLLVGHVMSTVLDNLDADDLTPMRSYFRVELPEGVVTAGQDFRHIDRTPPRRVELLAGGEVALTRSELTSQLLLGYTRDLLVKVNLQQVFHSVTSVS
jgi:hypothetical protein